MDDVDELEVDDDFQSGAHLEAWLHSRPGNRHQAARPAAGEYEKIIQTMGAVTPQQAQQDEKLKDLSSMLQPQGEAVADPACFQPSDGRRGALAINKGLHGAGMHSSPIKSEKRPAATYAGFPVKRLSGHLALCSPLHVGNYPINKYSSQQASAKECSQAAMAGTAVIEGIPENACGGPEVRSHVPADPHQISSKAAQAFIFNATETGLCQSALQPRVIIPGPAGALMQQSMGRPCTGQPQSGESRQVVAGTINCQLRQRQRESLLLSAAWQASVQAAGLPSLESAFWHAPVARCVMTA
jgi:hypothetical protein